MRSVKVNTKDGEVTISEGEEISFIVNDRDYIISGIVKSIYGRDIILEDSGDCYNVSDISQII